MSEVRTQAELNAALQRGDEWVDIVGDGEFEVSAFDSATVSAFGSATVRAFDSATVRAFGSATVSAGALVPVHDYGPATKITGGAIVIPIRTPETMDEWCTFYDVETTSRGWATVYKAVDADLNSSHGFAYPIGDEVACPDWDAGQPLGNGLHFSPRAFMALAYVGDAARFLAVKVKVSECVVLGDKIKAPRCKVLGEVDEDGVEVAA